jgi:hypothetical protein
VGKTRFLCEFCGQEVPYNIDKCPYCGKIFTAVKCPVCHMTGKPDDFYNGCPRCGYMTPRPRTPKSRKANPAAGRAGASRGKKPLPHWFYPASGVVLVLVLIALILLFVFRFMRG